ncbi:GspH/FimT family pseudopilin [Zobellella maritima]|uniref:GspH/FimT family pseudopilin n=1 Tax=Zobellella maritima TaxID=2059725 RepID=UPI001E353579|nr:GspH/FimT family protein [Zobellella maritima]
MKRGFTLLELLVVLVIAMLALAVVTPRFAALLPGVELKVYSRQTAALLRLARSQAISRGEEVALNLDAEARETRVADNVYPWPDNIGLQLQPTNDSQAAQPPLLVFYPDGSASGGMVIVSSSSRQYLIEVNWLTGKVNVHE